MMPNWIFWIIIACTIFFLLFALFLYFHLVHSIKKVIYTLNDVKSGDYNQRVRLHTNSPFIQRFVKKINELLRQFQTNMSHNVYLEKERKKMIANISHDLKTPLTSLLGYIEMVNNDQTLTPEEKEEFMRIAYQKGNKLSDLLNVFFQIAQLDSGDYQMNFQKVDINRMIKETIVDYYHDLKTQKMELDMKLPDNPVYVWADPKSMENILVNLISNGFIHGKDGNMLGIHLEVKECVSVHIWDNGKGIAEKDIANIFTRLYTGDKSRQHLGHGNGLGLTITKKLIEKNNGAIQVRSIPYKETIFSFSLPLCE
ncbi:sensor histidine kinase [Oceanobacillus jeddahense]|uniref:histidine kinase n=1 Tax=Oceanobacillus jeddahense TaxID=1462527 RepID=A0ABY5JY23_9BACI|nr:HAMP domain-containing sensor histidine kinase [Oceanobacillus jeddahense]UUI04966.1 HAMP domain-containing histidine kinase [Oceanobacillus jeddahense]